MSRRIVVFAVLMMIALPVAVGGTGEKGEWELGLFVGYGFLDDYKTSGPDLEPEDDFLFGGRVGYFFTPKWSMEGSYQMLSTETDFSGGGPQLDVDLESVRVNVLRNFRAGETMRPFATIGLGNENTDVDTAGDENDLGFNLGGGVRWYLTDHFGLRVDGRLVSVDVGGPVDDRQNNIEAAFGVLWSFGGKEPRDSDGDGVINRRDKCPDTPRGAEVDADGCPKDSDGDGVYDGIDKCPDTPAGTPVDRRGCTKDTDGDGVHDGIDKCADTPRGAAVDADGCPKDSDGDGVYDGIDKCPDTPEGATVDRKGCPKDSDRDGVYDGIDRCPDTPGGTEVDVRGCPVLFEDDRTLVLEGVNFEFNSDQLTANSESTLNRVAQSLRQWPEIQVEVAGHTDAIGSDKYNNDLSQRRAESVRRYLVNKGVKASQLMAKGYGETQPIADNDSDAGRDKNRRVELRKLGE